MIWDQLTSPQLSNVDKKTPVILTITATEQHGDHLPLATDRMIGEYFAKTLDEVIPTKVLILPIINFGCSEHHMDFPGTLSLTHKNFAGLVDDLITSVIQHGFKKIILFNSHGGNQAIGQVILEKMSIKYPDIQFVMATWWKIATEALKKLAASDFGTTGHGGEFETSLMLLIAPHLVKKEKIKKGLNTKTFTWSEADLLHSPQAVYYRTMKQMTPNGVYGNPEYASKEKGQKITECVIHNLKKIVLDFAKTEPVK